MWHLDQDVPMRDGCVLKADVWLPYAEGSQDTRQLPVLLYRTPYNKRNAINEWTVFKKIQQESMRFALVVMDVRGRYASSGEVE